jgi:hypothetical protein
MISDTQKQILKRLYNGERLFWGGMWCGNPPSCMWCDVQTLKEASVNRKSVESLIRLRYAEKVKIDDSKYCRSYNIVITPEGRELVESELN